MESPITQFRIAYPFANATPDKKRESVVILKPNEYAGFTTIFVEGKLHPIQSDNLGPSILNHIKKGVIGELVEELDDQRKCIVGVDGKIYIQGESMHLALCLAVFAKYESEQQRKTAPLLTFSAKIDTPGGAPDYVDSTITTYCDEKNAENMLVQKYQATKATKGRALIIPERDAMILSQRLNKEISSIDIIPNLHNNHTDEPLIIAVSQNSLPRLAKFIGISLFHYKRDSAVSRSVEISKPNKLELRDIKPPRSSPISEKRLVTVMICEFNKVPINCDLSEDEIKEIFTERIYKFISLCIKKITDQKGHITYRSNTKMHCCFGYKEVYEDDVYRAVYSGILVIRELTSYNEQCAKDGIKLTAKIGVHSSPAICGYTKDDDFFIETSDIEETIGLLNSFNKSAAIVVSSYTRDLLRKFLDIKNLEKIESENLPNNIEIYQVSEKEIATNRAELIFSSNISPFLGRNLDLSLLHEKFERINEYDGQMVLIYGEAGIGKSRLIEQFKKTNSHIPEMINCYCSPLFQNTIFYPIVECFSKRIQLHKCKTPDEKICCLEKEFTQCDFDLSESVPLFARLISLDTEKSYKPLKLSPNLQKEKFLQLFVNWIVKLSEKKPVFFVIEDLHWCDSATMEFISILAQQIATARVLAVFSFRPKFTSKNWQNWVQNPNVTSHRMQPLMKSNATKLVHSIVQKNKVSDEFVKHVVQMGNGIPLFLELLSKIPTDKRKLKLDIPKALKALFQSYVGKTKEIVQIGSVIGREFDYKLLRFVSSLKDEYLNEGLNELVENGLINKKGFMPDSQYIFRHALIQKESYNLILRKDRKNYHNEVANGLMKLYSKSAHSELIAYHFTEAENFEQAVIHWRKAAEYAQRVSANNNAVAHLQKALELVTKLPNKRESIEQTIDLTTMLATSLAALKGFPSICVKEAYLKALSLADKLDGKPFSKKPPILRGLWTSLVVRGELENASDSAKTLLKIAKEKNDSSLLVESYRVVGSTYLYLGQLTLAKEYLEKSFDFFNSINSEEHLKLYGQDPEVNSYSYLALTLCHFGKQKQAIEHGKLAISKAESIDHPFSLAFTLFFNCWINLFLSSIEVFENLVNKMLLVSNEQSFRLWQLMGIFFNGWLIFNRGDSKGIGKMEEGVQCLKDIGVNLFFPCCFGLLAEAYRRDGQNNKSLHCIEKGIECVKTGESYYEAELYHQQGLLFIEDDKEKARKFFEKAIKTAEEKSSLLWKSKAISSLQKLN